MFNEYIGKGEAGWVIYNNYSGAMLEIPLDLCETIQSANISAISDSDILSGLERGNFIVGFDKDEINELIDHKNSLDTSAVSFALQLLPTLHCNFRCSYCYENQQSNSTTMTFEIMDSIIGYLRTIIRPTTKYAYVSWYGGEPLLAMRQIDYLSRSLRDVCKANNVKYHSVMATNGYLLTEEKLKRLIDYDVRTYQITLDGPQDIHDKKRQLWSGKGTFEQIIRNLERAIQNDINMTVRINIDKNNIGSIKQLLCYLKERRILEKVRIRFGNISSFGNACKSIEDELVTTDELIEYLTKSNILEMIKEAKEIERRQPVFNECIAKGRHSLIIGPSGEIYKCSKTIGLKSEICGNISGMDKLNENFFKWEKEDRFYVEQCRNCSMIPICSGDGCAHDFVIEKKNKNRCRQESRHLNHITSINYLYKQKQREV
jgi:uncharacterized protein